MGTFSICVTTGTFIIIKIHLTYKWCCRPITTHVKCLILLNMHRTLALASSLAFPTIHCCFVVSKSIRRYFCLKFIEIKIERRAERDGPTRLCLFMDLLTQHIENNARLLLYINTRYEMPKIDGVVVFGMATVTFEFPSSTLVTLGAMKYFQHCYHTTHLPQMPTFLGSLHFIK